jgi:hypothetical protein
MIKIATWNVCLGMKNKRDLITETLRREKIDICCLQEIEIENNYPINILASKDYKFECETNDIKSRTGMYIKNCIDYVRMYNLEGSNNGLVIIDIKSSKSYRLINVYRVFNPQNGRTATENFKNQLQIIVNSILSDPAKNIIVTGDFNLDDVKKFCIDYQNRHLFNLLIEAFDPLGLYQLIDFPTWERVTINGVKCSILDHLYVRDCTLVTEINSIKPPTGDHLLVTFQIEGKLPVIETVMKRNWQNYSKNILEIELSKIKFENEKNSVQSMWNTFENQLIQIVDKIVPIVPFKQNATVTSQKPTSLIKNKMNLRKRLLRQFKITKNPDTGQRIKNLNCEIRCHFEQSKKKRVRLGLIPGNNKTLWDSVRIAKDTNIQTIPRNMSLNNEPIPVNDLPDAFASHFKNKITNIVNESRINPNVFNGNRKVNVENKNFVTEKNILDAISSLKTKNCEGYDRIPQRILIDGAKFFIVPFMALFNQIYETKEIPEQWLVAKVMPIFKKGNVNQVENYRPVANLCSTSKIFEKLILQRLNQIEFENLIDLTNKSQHGFKKNHSTNSAALMLQSVLASALDENKYALMSSLDLSAAFDVVNVKLLLKRLRILGLPDDVVVLIDKWLSVRHFFVSLGDSSSIIHSLNVGTVQGSILGPILYAIFVSPLFELAKMTKFADDNFIIKCNKFIQELIVDMKMCLEMIIKWLKDSGLKVNDAKTEICLFHRSDTQQIQIEINGFIVKSKPTMGVLGLIFDSKLQWGPQVENAIKKSNKAKHAIMLIRKFFSKIELNGLLTSNYYSILFYNCDVWLIPSLKPQLKQQILSASARALRICTPNYDNTISFEQIHVINKRATPKQMMIYKHAILLYKVWNDSIYSKQWLALNFQQNFNERVNTVNVFETSNLKVGKNIVANRLKIINGLIRYEWLNLGMNSFKIMCKKELM